MKTHYEIHALLCSIHDMTTGMDNTSTSIRTLSLMGMEKIENIIETQEKRLRVIPSLNAQAS